jgi:hypothetical protein
MSELLLRLRALSPDTQPNAALLESIGAIDTRNRELLAAMLQGLDEQDELAHHYERLMRALLTRQGVVLPQPEAAEVAIHNVTLQHGWS